MRKKRVKLIAEIEKQRKSKLLVYITGDRPPFGARIAEDAVRPMYDHIAKFNKENKKLDKIDLFVYSRGGDVSVPWRIVSMLREFCEELSVLIPYKAYSATTMIALGSDNIVMGRKAELGPIDPTLERMPIGSSTVSPDQISVEDVSSYISFMRERANINDQMALSNVISLLAEHVQPLTLGSINRQYSHIRLVAKKLLTSRKEKMDEERLSTIIEALTEKMYSHGHGIGRKEAKELGLSVIFPDEKLEKTMWDLFLEYEKLLKLNEPLHFEQVLADKEEDILKDIVIALIESTYLLDVFDQDIRVRKVRNIPPNPQINLNLNLSLPPQIDPSTLPENAQIAIQQIMEQISKTLPQMIQDEMSKQSPVVGIESRSLGGSWKKRKNEKSK
ncbi:MAG: hypothetical protein A7316_05005 [Candidatus Altiarchaeales archaeon WOR_SM1_86-2]|nr:MAG: hypothetical protein A7315_13685 [Candidatus Altiarchaeales archaeon WOR_SM1_79]ODS39647.1 MAG: hypothetical protein A7316_05005 [Candidatus Altiarchaeales archaeon WOR_SM1_86-2]